MCIIRSTYLFVLIKEKGGGEPFANYLKASLVNKNLYGPGKVRVSQSRCLGRCRMRPCLVIYPEGVWYTYATEQDINQIIDDHLISGKTVRRLLLDSPDSSTTV